MSQYKGSGDPDKEELVPHTPIVVNGRTFNPKTCVDSADPNVPHVCVHDWSFYWGNQNRAQ